MIRPLFRFAAIWDIVLGLVFGLGFVAGIFPALRAMRLRIVDALRRV